MSRGIHRPAGEVEARSRSTDRGSGAEAAVGSSLSRLEAPRPAGTIARGVGSPQPSRSRPARGDHRRGPSGPLPGAAAVKRGLRAVTGRFLRCERASAAIESTIAVSVLVGAFAGLMGTVNTTFTGDQTGRGARVVARALALDPNANPWEALGTEIDLAHARCPKFDWADAPAAACVGDKDDDGDGEKDAVDCLCDGWKMAIDRGVSPGTLATVLGGGTTPNGKPNGEMILVRLYKGQSPGSIGLARSEPEA